MNWTELKSKWRHQNGPAQSEIELTLLRPIEKKLFHRMKVQEEKLKEDEVILKEL